MTKGRLALWRLALATTLIAFVSVLAPKAAVAASFSDTPADAWYVQEGWIDYVEDMGLMSGYKDPATQAPTGEFGPDDQITRGQVATIIYRVFNDPMSTMDPSQYVENDGTFTDLPGKYYYNAAVLWCAQSGIVTGYKDPATQEPTGEFGPEDPVTRDQMATMLYRVIVDLYEYDPVLDGDSKFTSMPDYGDVMPFAKEAMRWAFDNGILTGDKVTGLLNPLGQATRAQAAKMLTVTLRDILGMGVVTPNPESDFTYEVKDEGVYITGLKTDDGHVIVPAVFEAEGRHFAVKGVELDSADELKNLESLELLSPEGSLVIKNAPKLSSLVLQNAALDTFAVSDCPALRSLYVYNSKLPDSLPLSSMPDLESLVLMNCGLKSLDVTSLSNLSFLDCSGNELTALDISKNEELESLYCQDNKIQDKSALEKWFKEPGHTGAM